MFRTVEMFLFDTCTHKCAYCELAESGKVLDVSQMKPYRDPEFIDRIVDFFNSRTNDTDKWLLQLSGGEPLLMPNLARLANGVASKGNKVAFYTAMLVGENHPGYRFLLEEGAAVTDYLMVSFHPEAEEIEDKFFGKLQALKAAGHSVIFRLVGHPQRLHRLEELSARCRDLDIAFHPTPLFSDHYPAAYTTEQRERLLKHASSLSQIVQLEGGVKTDGTLCSAGSTLFAVYMRTGNITPCISVAGPILGNIYEDRLRLMPPAIYCPQKGVMCICDVHFQQGVVQGGDDRAYFEAEKKGFVEPVPESELRDQLRSLRFGGGPPGIGHTKTADFLALDNQTVKSAFEGNKDFLLGQYTDNSHPFYKSRQFG